MFRLIRFRLVLSYAGIALLVTLALGAVLLVRLRAYYAGMELAYLYGNAKMISAMAAPMLVQNYPQDVREAQVSNLAFLSQTRVRILDLQNNLLADSGPWQPSNIGLGVVRVSPIEKPDSGNISVGPSPVIILQKQTTNSDPASGPVEYRSQIPEGVLPDGGLPFMLFFQTGGSETVRPSPPGSQITVSQAGPWGRSNQIVQEPIVDSSGILLGYVQLSESPEYGLEIVKSVASGLAVAGGLAILLAIGVGWLTSRRFTAPLINLTQATQQMSGGDLSVRVVESERGDEFGLLGKSFNQMAGRIEETVQTLRRFLADAAHELQTPLTALRTNLELARSDENLPATQEYLTHALEQIERLQRMMRDLLSLSRLENATGREEFQALELNGLARQVCEPYAARAEQAGQTLALDLLPGDLPVMGSPEKLGSALGNLLDNALKFTPPGGSITIRSRESADGACLTVSDTGIGIPPDEIEMLFNRFHRGRNVSTYPGSGLGLAIVRAILQAQGGSVHAMNNPQGGASFTICLPQLKAAPAPKDRRPASL